MGLTNGGVTADRGGISPPLPTLLGVMGPAMGNPAEAKGVALSKYPGGVLPSGVVGLSSGEAVV
jgi:hypothetical protein